MSPPHQDEAIIELLGGSNVVLATPTGPGKSLVAVAAHAAALAGDWVSFYIAPIKTLASEKFFALCEVFGPENVGMLTGNASVNADAPVICCTAEVLANIALREGDLGFDSLNRRSGGLVVWMSSTSTPSPIGGGRVAGAAAGADGAQFLLSRRLSTTSQGWRPTWTRRTGRETAVVDDAERPVPLRLA
jgi:hypothetical protein